MGRPWRVLLALFLTAATCAGEPQVAPSPTVSWPREVPPDPCDGGVWAERCPEAEWLRRTVPEAGFRPRGDTGTALRVETPGGLVGLWGVSLERLIEAERAGEVESRDEELARYPAPFRAMDTDVYLSGTWATWEAQSVVVWVHGWAEAALDRGHVTELVLATTTTAYDPRTYPACGPHEGAYRPSAFPTRGIPGDRFVLWSEEGTKGKGGQPVRRPDHVDLEVWWNLELDDWTSKYRSDPTPAGPGPVLIVGTARVPGACAWRVTARIPEVAPGTYEVVVVVETADDGASASSPVEIRVGP